MSKGDTTVDKVLELSLHGYGVVWHPIHAEFRPFSVDEYSISFWDDPEGIGGEIFDEAVDQLYEVWKNGIAS